jgi:hypothetical protein
MLQKQQQTEFSPCVYWIYVVEVEEELRLAKERSMGLAIEG